MQALPASRSEMTAGVCLLDDFVPLLRMSGIVSVDSVDIEHTFVKQHCAVVALNLHKRTN